MTKYNFDKLKKGDSAFYPVGEGAEKGFRSALSSWVKKRRENEFMIIQCNQVIERGIMGNKIFLGMRITREE